MVIGTVDGVVVLERAAHGWKVKHRALGGCSVSAVTASDDGTLYAATHGFGAARSDDGGLTWTWVLDGLDHMDLWSARAGKLAGRDVVGVGALPAHLYISENRGKTWRELPALRSAPSVGKWCFPPPPRIGHVKDIVFDGDRLLVGIEIGALLVSKDFGESFTELVVDPDPVECDIHRVLVHPDRPHRLIVANGIVGVMSSDDDGATWRKNPMPPLRRLSRRHRGSSRRAGYRVPHRGRRLAVALVRDRQSARQDRAQPRRRQHLAAPARRPAERPARSVLRAHHRSVAGRFCALMRSIPTASFLRAPTKATIGPSSPRCRRCRRVNSIALWHATAASWRWTISSSAIPPANGSPRWPRDAERSKPRLEAEPILSIWPANGKPTWPGKTNAPVDAQSSSTRRRLTRASSTSEFFGKFQSGL